MPVPLTFDNTDVTFDQTDLTWDQTVLETVMPVGPDRELRTIYAYVGERVITSHSLVDAAGEDIDLSSRTLSLHLHNNRRVHESTVTPAVNGSDSSVFSAVLEAESTERVRWLWWALWDTTDAQNPFVLAAGILDVRYAAAASP